MVIDRSLITRIGELSDRPGPGTVGVLIIDEPQSFPVDRHQALIENQQRLLVAAGRFGCRFWMIELNFGVASSRTLLRLRALVHSATPIVAKTRANAFDGTDLNTRLQAAHVTHVVLLGHEANMCVKQTAIGGQYKRTQPFVAGATGRGYKVMTSDLVLSHNMRLADWKDADRVEFYTML